MKEDNLEENFIKINYWIFSLLTFRFNKIPSSETKAKMVMLPCDDVTSMEITKSAKRCIKIM